MMRAHTPRTSRGRTGSVVALAGLLALAPAAAAQKLGVNCLADGGTNCTALIPDGAGSLASTVTIPPGCASIARVCVALGVEHSEMTDVAITLSHGATSVPIAAGTSPDLRLAAVLETEFDGQSGSGPWTLSLQDGTSGDYGALNNWALGLCCGADCGDGLVRVDPLSGLVTTESGGTAQFGVELTCPPFHEVAMAGIASSDASEGVANVGALTFDAMNWAAAQVVVATGQDDPLLDGDIPYVIPVGAATVGGAFATLEPADLYNPPSVYAGAAGANVALLNLDNETDLAISKQLDSAGPPAIYTIAATNEGPGTVMGATVTDTFPAGMTCTWTCSAAGGGTCTAGPVAGDISDMITLPPGASAVYTASCAYSGAVSLANTASIAPPGGVTDLDGSDNSDSVAQAGPAPAPALGPWGLAVALLLLAAVAGRRLRQAR